MDNLQRRRNRTGANPTIIFLIAQIYQNLEQLPHKPPVTIVLIFINIIAYIHPDVNVFGFYLNNIGQNCIQPSKIITSIFANDPWPLNRLILSAIIHADDMHLYYNMTSLCWKGINLELQMGSESFAKLVAFSLIVSHSIMIGLSYFLYLYIEPLGYPNISGYNSCAVGFSAVLFSLKYVLNFNSPSTSNILGITIPTKYLAWFELVLTSVLNPSASFVGHLAGILAGMVYIHIPRTIQFGISMPGSFHSLMGNRSYTYAQGHANTSGRWSSSAPISGSRSSQPSQPSVAPRNVAQMPSQHRRIPSPSSASSSPPDFEPESSDGLYLEDLRELRLRRFSQQTRIRS